MFLLGLDENALKSTVSTVPAPDLHGCLEDVFEIRLGLVRDRHLRQTHAGVSPVYFAGPKIFYQPRPEEVNGQLLSWEKQISLIPEWRQEIESGKETREDAETTGTIKFPINDSHLLRMEDFLISTRGVPHGYPLYDIPEIREYPLVATHFFIRMRPHDPERFNIRYLHLLLDNLVRGPLLREFISKEEETRQDSGKLNTRQSGKERPRKTYAAFNSVNKSDLQSRPFSYHSNRKDQDMVVESFLEHYRAYQETAIRLYNFRSMISANTVN